VRPPADAPRAHDYLKILTRYWLVVVLATLLSAGAGWLVWDHQRTFVASAKFMVVTPGGAQPFDAFYGNVTAESRTLTYQDLIRTPQIRLRIEDQLGLSAAEANDLVQRIVVIPTQSPLFDVVVSDEDPDAAVNTVNTLARTMVQVSQALQSVDASAAGLVLVDAASGAGDARGKWSSAMLIGGLLGLAVSVVAIVGYGLARGSVTNRRQIARVVEGVGSTKSWE
jgi:capsular polysaccharide biosynthesis protein